MVTSDGRYLSPAAPPVGLPPAMGSGAAPPFGPAAPPASGRFQTRTRSLPIAVAAGLATGVFVGLLLSRSDGRPVAGRGDAVSGAALAIDAGPAAHVAVADAGAVAVHPPDAGVVAHVAPDAGKPQPTRRLAKLAFEVDPVDAIVTVDGKPIAGGEVELSLGPQPRKVKVEAKARGFHPFTKVVAVDGNDTVKIHLHKAHVGGGPTGPGSSIHL